MPVLPSVSVCVGAAVRRPNRSLPASKKSAPLSWVTTPSVPTNRTEPAVGTPVDTSERDAGLTRATRLKPTPKLTGEPLSEDASTVSRERVVPEAVYVPSNTSHSPVGTPLESVA